MQTGDLPLHIDSAVVGKRKETSVNLEYMNAELRASMCSNGNTVVENTSIGN
jgi:hypothetical protein